MSLWQRIFPPKDNRPAHVIDAERHPENYFDCTVCGSGPWHNSWAWRDYGGGVRDMPKRPLGGCCSGAD